MLTTKVFRKTMSMLGLSYFLLMAFYLGASIVISSVFALIFYNNYDATWIMWVVNALSLYAVAFPLFIIVINKLIPFKVKAPMKVGLSAKQAILFVIFMLGAAYAFNFITVMLQTIITELTGFTEPNIFDELLADGEYLWLFISACIIAPIGEEILFRKILHKKIGHLGDVCYIITSGVLFGLFHGNLTQLLYACALGCLFAYVFVRTGDILIPIALHFIMNIIGTMIIPTFGISEVGAVVTGALVIVFIALATLIFIKALMDKALYFNKPYRLLPKKAIFHSIFNVGMIVYFLCMGALIVSNYFLADIVE